MCVRVRACACVYVLASFTRDRNPPFFLCSPGSARLRALALDGDVVQMLKGLTGTDLEQLTKTDLVDLGITKARWPACARC